MLSVCAALLLSLPAAAPTDAMTAVIEHWDGSAWTIVPAPYPNGALLHCVYAVASSDVWATGQYTASNGSIQPLFEHWDGAAWSVASEGAGTRKSGGIMYRLSALSPTDIWAVGYRGTPRFGSFLPLAEHWNGTAWTSGTAALAAEDEEAPSDEGEPAPEDSSDSYQ